MNIKYLLVILSLLFAVLACQNDTLFKQEQTLSQPYWTYRDSLRFEFPIQDTNLLYDLFLNIEHTPDYSYQNLYTYITTSYPSGKVLQQQLNIDLADKAGKWYAKCNTKSCRLQVILQQNAYFNEIGQHTISLVQHTRQDSLLGLTEIGFELKKVGNKANTK